jgi:hypothetical protein
MGIPLMLLNALDTYNGTTEPKEWLRTFEKVAIAAEWTPSKRMRMAHLFLKGEADKWLQAEPNSNTWTWEDFVANFTERFTRSGAAYCIRRMFETRKQQKGETARSFLCELQYIATKLSERISDGNIMYRFIDGLRPDLQALVYTTMPNTLREAVEAADYFEAMAEHENMVEIKPKPAPADLRTQIDNLQSEIHQLQNYFAQREAYTCSTYLNQEDETIEEDEMANFKLALDAIQLELNVIAELVNMDQPLASHASTPPHDTFPIYTVQELGGIMVADDLPLRVEEKEPGKSNMAHYMPSREIDGAFMPTDDLYGREQTQNNFMDYGKESRKVKKKRPRPYVRVRSTTIGLGTPALAAPRTRNRQTLKLAQGASFAKNPSHLRSAQASTTNTSASKHNFFQHLSGTKDLRVEESQLWRSSWCHVTRLVHSL